MNEISTIGQNFSQDQPGTNNSILGKDDFLRILVTQLRNQDPINPVNGDDLAVQLAQFSSVEQLQNINSNLENNIEMDLLLNQAINNTMATTLIGREVRAAGNEIYRVDGEDTAIQYHLSGLAKDVKIQIEDADGTVVRTIVLSDQTEGNHHYKWDGKDDNGNKVSEGTYQFTVKAEDAEGNPVSAQEFVAGTITSIRYENGSAVLLIGDVEINFADVIEIGLSDDAGEGNIKKARTRN